MRTTLTIDDDILTTVRYLADQKKVAIGTMISELVRKGLQKKVDLDTYGDFPLFPVSKNSAIITPEHVKMLEDD